MVKKPPTHKNGAIKGMVFTWHFWFTACEIHGIQKKNLMGDQGIITQTITKTYKKLSKTYKNTRVFCRCSHVSEHREFSIVFFGFTSPV